MQKVVLAIDEGTTNSKAVLMSNSGKIIARGSAPVPITHPRPGWVQQDANAIWEATQKAIATCIEGAPGAEILALGISNQRESILIWDCKSGTPLGPVVTWQCRRTSVACETLKSAGHEPEVIARTGLPLDPLFPPTKVRWLVKNHGQSSNDICIGTVDSWLIWKFSGGAVHATDRSNASRTQMFNLAEGCWDEFLCTLFGVDSAALPEVYDSAHIFGMTSGAGVIPDGIPIASSIGDSHAALFGHGAFRHGDGKVTFGTGSSVMTTIPEFVVPPKGITTTIAWSLSGQSTYAFEGNILVSASVLPWTANLLGIESVEALLDLAQTVEDTDGVSLIPAHAGLGSPHWNPGARGLICGLSFGSGPAHVARAATESMALQVNDVYSIVVNAVQGIGRLFVDGEPSRSQFLMQLVADCINHPVYPCRNSEASAIGAAYLAGLAVGFWSNLDAVACFVSHDAAIKPSVLPKIREAKIAAWKKAITRTVCAI